MVKILISEDIDIIRDLIEHIIMEIEGISIIGKSKSYEEDIQMIENLNPDIIVTDLVKNGVEKAFDIAKKYNDKRFILVTGMDKEYVNYKILKYNLNNIIACISKPFSRDNLKSIIKKSLKEF